MRYLLALVLILAFAFPCLSEAASRTLTWDAYTAPSDFKEFRVFRALQNCTAQGPLAPLVINSAPVVISKPTTGPMPTSFVDTTVPAMDGTICYELTSVDLTGNDARSNRTSLVVDTNPPPAVTGLKAQ